ncbi:uncharacterized protein LOC132194439 [Neocloeon triangulifer]|uniref:uncharacterized protein LOC132194439 n=1 Tax=Neocloeon triangulifer TaxID=2078957 RepID=UPI00286F9FA0|nr:uncharacterized protein LOC132194439 [Neocloeon triangulifer]
MHVGRSYKYFLLILIAAYFSWLIIMPFKKRAVFVKYKKSLRDPYNQLEIDRTVFGPDLKKEIAKKFNVPLAMPDKIAAGLRFNASCAKYTPPMKITFSNIYWQVQEINSIEVTNFMYGAYFDNRTTISAVRIVAFLTKFVDNETSLYCQLWFEDERKPAIDKPNSDQKNEPSSVLDHLQHSLEHVGQGSRFSIFG